MDRGPPPALDAQLTAHRRVLHWLLNVVVRDEDTCRQLLAALDQSYPPQDFQEDPGAVPTEAFGFMAAYNIEMRALLGPLKERFAVKTGEGTS